MGGANDEGNAHNSGTLNAYPVLLPFGAGTMTAPCGAETRLCPSCEAGSDCVLLDPLRRPATFQERFNEILRDARRADPGMIEPAKTPDAIWDEEAGQRGERRSIRMFFSKTIAFEPKAIVKAFLNLFKKEE